MAEYIEREALGIGKCNPDVFEDKGYAKGWNAAIDVIQNAPAADVAPVVHGKWNAVKGALHPAETSAVCSNCGFATMIHAQTFYHFCPNCGADMMEES